MVAMQKQTGFTLIELMIVLVVIVILSAWAYTSYDTYTLKTRQREAQVLMQDSIARRIEEWKTANPNQGYNAALLTQNYIYGSTTIVSNKVTTYSLQLTVGSPNALGLNMYWELVATPIGAQQKFKGKGAMRLNSRGWTCWSGNDTECTLTADSTWKK